MAIRIVGETRSREQVVDHKMVIDTVEKNRDRVRALVTMMIQATSILFSANLAILALIKDKLDTFPSSTKVLFLVSPVLLLSALVTAMRGMFLRRAFFVTTPARFVDSLLALYSSELKAARIGFFLFLLGLGCLVAAIGSILLN